ncbi:hypothetical protein [Polyangium jinanense]|uniref:Uncharacterized protein n=1 Tax=Polyangium jinanense TaxID=2829994 RepID=A0A9X3XFQ1_9BACT|nr:hypothetical protein [Polyangium jinanense]MDC3962359.1 hypothetical protein [Polyangium jinanense]MDC3989157.1 hypothetical protein [Polyangium jinanense]
MRTLGPTAFLLASASIVSCGGAEPAPPSAPPTERAAATAKAPPPEERKPPKRPKPVANTCAPPTAPIEELTTAEGAEVFTTDGAYLVWSDGRAIVRASLNGGDRKTLIADVTKNAAVRGLRLSNGEVWFRAENRYDQGCAGLVGFVGRNGGPVTSVGLEGCISGFALTPDRVVFTREESVPTITGISSGLYAAPRKGGPAKTLLRPLGGYRGVAADGAFVYFPGGYDGLHRMPIGGGEAVEVSNGKIGNAFGGIDGSRFTVDGDEIFALHGHPNLGGMQMARLGKDGKDAQLLGPAVPAHPSGATLPAGPLVTDAQFVYWASPLRGAIFRVPKDGACPPYAIATDREKPDWVAVAGSYVYWLELDAKPPRIARRKLYEDPEPPVVPVANAPPSVAPPPPATPEPKLAAAERPFVLSGAFAEPTAVSFAGGKVFALLVEGSPKKGNDEGPPSPYWIHVFELRGTKFQPLKKHRIEGHLLAEQVVEKNGKLHLVVRDPSARGEAHYYEPLAGGKRLPGYDNEWEEPTGPHMPPSCEASPPPASKLAPMRDLYGWPKHEGARFFIGTSCDGKPKIQVLFQDKSQMIPIEPSDELMHTQLGIVWKGAAGVSVFENGAFRRIAAYLPKRTWDLLRAPDGTIVARGDENFALRGEEWAPWRLEFGSARFTVASDGAALWAYVGDSSVLVTELYRYAPGGAKDGERIDTSTARLPKGR